MINSETHPATAELAEYFSSEELERALRDKYRQLYQLREPLGPDAMSDYLFLLDRLIPALHELLQEE